MNIQTKILVIAGIAFMLIGLMIGVPIGKGCTKCPEIKIGTETTLVQVIVHDTVRVEKTGSKDIVVGKKVVNKVDPVSSDILTQDTTTCYSFEEDQEDGAYTKCEVCSDSLPVSSESVSGVIRYRAPTESLRTISRVDTVTFTKSPPFHKDWKTYVIGIFIAVSTGLIAAR